MPGSWRTSVLAVTSCFALSLMPLVADAAGLGKVTVFSALGQPLRAEIEVTATREELSGMKAQLASRDAFRQAGIDLAGSIQGISFSLDKRPNGQNVIRLSSNAPVNDPFLDMLIELTWSSGRMVREYTFLLDPPEIAAKNAAVPIAVTSKAQAAPVSEPVRVAPVQVPAPAPSSAAPAESAAPVSSSIDEATRARALQASQNASAVAAEPARPAETAVASARASEKTTERSADSRQVKPGDTLSKIAQATKPEGVTLEQMLVGLLRANQEAFDGGNMNRLRSGRILSIPEKSDIEAIAPAEARKVVMAQSGDWNAYRARLAGLAAKAPATERDATQASAGKITAKVEEKPLPESAPKDQVKVSKSETGAASGTPGKRSVEDEVAKKKAMREANERAAALEKNVASLQKLLEVKDQTLADAQKQAAKPEAGTSAPPAPTKAVEPPKVAEPAKSEPAAVPAPVAAAAPVPGTAPADDMPKPKPKPAAADVPPPEPSFVDMLLDDPMVPAGGAGVIALLAAFLLMRRRAAKTAEAAPAATVAAPAESVSVEEEVPARASAAPEPVAATAQEIVEEEEGAEVDPIAEADVYLAYGRDAQAEEILRAAQASDPERLAIPLKLLDIYVQRKDATAFEREAVKLRDATNGVGSDWEKVVALGLALDPTNPLYGGVPEASAETPAAPEVVELTPSMPEPVEEIVLADAAPEESAPAEAPSESIELASLDSEQAPAATTEASSLPAAEASAPSVSVDVAPLDFDLPPAVQEATAGPTADTLDFSLPDLDLGDEPPAPAVEPAATPARAEEDTGLDFNLDFDALAPAEAPAEASAVAPESGSLADEPGAFNFDLSEPDAPFDAVPAPVVAPFDMSSITLELDEEKPGAALEAEPVAVSAPFEVELPAPTADLPDPGLLAASSPEVEPFASENPEPVVEDLPDPGTAALTVAEELPEIGMAPAEAPAELDASFEPENEEAATKLDLAKAYEEMGDLEGARELLGEVVEEGNAGQRAKARALLDKIGP